jgi:hypothetical protein
MLTLDYRRKRRPIARNYGDFLPFGRRFVAKRGDSIAIWHDFQHTLTIAT